MKLISKNDLVSLLEKTQAKSVTITYNSDVKMTKTNNPFYIKEGRTMKPIKDVTKRVTMEYDFGGASYEDRVNEALINDGSTNVFKGDGLKGFEWVVVNKVLKKDNNLYIRVYLNDEYPVKEYTYFVDNVKATDSEIETIKEFTPKKTESAKQLDAGLEKEKQIKPISLSFDKIESISFDGEDYVIA